VGHRALVGGHRALVGGGPLRRAPRAQPGLERRLPAARPS
jgi:hypothetical protein